MADQAVDTYTPLDVPVPPVPAADFYTEQQWKTLLVLADTVIPSIRTPEPDQSSLVKVVPSAEWDAAVAVLASRIKGPDAARLAKQYLEEAPSSNPHFKPALQRLFGQFVHEEGRNGLGLILNALK